MSKRRINLNLDESLLAEIDVIAENWCVDRTSAISIMLSKYTKYSDVFSIMPNMIDTICKCPCVIAEMLKSKE